MFVRSVVIIAVAAASLGTAHAATGALATGATRGIVNALHAFDGEAPVDMADARARYVNACAAYGQLVAMHVDGNRSKLAAARLIEQAVGEVDLASCHVPA